MGEREHIDTTGNVGRGFTGFRCDGQVCVDAMPMLGSSAGKLVQCSARFGGRTETREQLRALTLRAEAAGWQCLFVDGVAMHFCPGHTDPDRPRRRSLR